MCSFSAFGLKSETNQSMNHISQMRHARLPICAISPFISKTKAREFKIKAESEIIKRCGRKQQQIRAGKIKAKKIAAVSVGWWTSRKRKNPKYLFFAEFQVLKRLSCYILWLFYVEWVDTGATGLWPVLTPQTLQEILIFTRDKITYSAPKRMSFQLN